jgi:tetratricopeptide (TPR) repeat protein
VERSLRGAASMKKLLITVFIFAALLLSVFFLHSSGLVHFQPIVLRAESFPRLQTLILNRKGIQLFQAQNYHEAFDQYVKALQYDPFSPELHLNIGLNYEAEQQADQAAKSYQNSLRYSVQPLQKFMALFNQAQLLGKAKKTDEALELYQAALELNPASKEVKTNIELLIQQQQQNQDGKSDDKDKKDEKKDSKDQKDQKKDSEKKDDGKKGSDKKDQDQNGDKDKKGQDQKNDKNKPDDQKEPKKDQDKEGDKDKDKDKNKKDQPKDQNSQDQKNQDQPKTPQKSEKYKPRPFKGNTLNESDVKKILGEIRQQEQKIRAEFNRKDVKEQPRDKDW